MTDGEWLRAKECSQNSCIEIGRDRGWVLIRANREGLCVVASADEWKAFIAGVKAGDFDHV